MLSSYAVTPQTSVLDLRNMLEALRPGTGVFAETDFVLTPANPEAGHAAQLSTGRALLTGETFRQGTYFVWSDATEILPWPAPASQPRIDTLILQQRDNAYGSTQGENGPVWKICQGAPASLPVALSDAAIRANHAEAGAWLYAYDVRVDPGQAALDPANITRRFFSISSRAKQSKLLTSTPSSSAFRNWLAENSGERKAFPSSYWRPVELVVPYTGEVKVTVTGRGYNLRSANSGIGVCYALSGANVSTISAFTEYEYLKRGAYNETASVVNYMTGLVPGLTTWTPNVWVSPGTQPSDLHFETATLIVEPVV